MNDVYAFRGAKHFVEKALHDALEILEDWKSQNRFLASVCICFSWSSLRETYVIYDCEAANGVFSGGPKLLDDRRRIWKMCFQPQWNGFVNIMT